MTRAQLDRWRVMAASMGGCSVSPLGHQLMHTDISACTSGTQSVERQILGATDQLLIEGGESRSPVLSSISRASRDPASCC